MSRASGRRTSPAGRGPVEEGMGSMEVGPQAKKARSISEETSGEGVELRKVKKRRACRARSVS
jgi:hypothetical protein